MALNPDLPFPKKQGDNIRSKDWNDAVVEIQRLDRDKLNLTGGTITGPLTVSGNLNVSSGKSVRYELGTGSKFSIGGNGTFEIDAPGVVGGRLIVAESGNVGIGITTPGFPLSFSNSVGDKISLWGQSANHYGFGIQGALLQIHTDGAGSDVAFGYGPSAAFKETMRVKGNGNVGIGTTDPGATRLLIAGVTSWENGFGLTGDSDDGVGMYLENKKGHKWYLLSGGKNTSVGNGGFGIYDSSASAYRLAIAPNGFIGMGTTDPKRPLHVVGHEVHSGGATGGYSFGDRGTTPEFVENGEGGKRWVWYAAGTSARLWTAGMDRLTVNPNGHVELLSSTNPILFSSIWQASPDRVLNKSEICNDTTDHKVLMIVGNRSAGGVRRVGIWDELYVATRLVASSDARMKEDITTLEGSLDKLLALRGVKFKWRAAADEAPLGIGLIAQEVEGVFPELVADAGLDGMKAINYSGFVAPLIEAVKQQQQQISSLRAELHELKAKGKTEETSEGN